MRIELSGSLVHVEPLNLIFTQDQDFSPEMYTALGYTHFEAICIGAGGGSGGGIDTANTGTLIRSYGGRGGGGGFHRSRGVLATLPEPCPISVGQPGADGSDHASNPALTTHGQDGGFSSFNDNTCQASGGEGGKRVQANADNVAPVADGGDGGLGNRTAAGGGGAGGVCGTPSPSGPGTPGIDGKDGTLINDIGAGGGGGAGGVGKYGTAVTCLSATAGGRGAYDPGDTSVYGPGANPSMDEDTDAADIVPGDGGGAKTAPLNSLPTVYGSSGQPGVVVLRLTAE